MENKQGVEGDLRIKAVAKALGEPFGVEFTDAVAKMRTHLLIAAVISIAAVLLDLRIKPDTPIFGVVFEGLTEQKILLGLLAINSYLIVHFWWCSLDSLKEWRLRRTGTMVAYVDASATSFFGNENLDFTDDARQSTLYRWWFQNAKRIVAVPHAIAKIDEQVTTMMAGVMEELSKGQTPALANLQTTFMSLREQLNAVTEAIKDAKKTLESERIPASLERFDSAFRDLLRSQNNRWLFLELMFPLGLGLVAIWMLGYKIYSSG
ncbi:hypothetical protein [Polaromonas sp.]|jgi:hypothetical protein|uniref:hypothetical protein n=1 Tax=Polaromonas sp. TaxID=1869339 RepID=UPI0037C9B6D6